MKLLTHVQREAYIEIEDGGKRVTITRFNNGDWRNIAHIRVFHPTPASTHWLKLLVTAARNPDVSCGIMWRHRWNDDTKHFEAHNVFWIEFNEGWETA